MLVLNLHPFPPGHPEYPASAHLRLNVYKAGLRLCLSHLSALCQRKRPSLKGPTAPPTRHKARSYHTNHFFSQPSLPRRLAQIKNILPNTAKTQTQVYETAKPMCLISRPNGL